MKSQRLSRGQISAANQMINLSSDLALLGTFDSFAAISKACIGMV